MSISEQDAAKAISTKLAIDEKESALIIEKAINGGEVKDPSELDVWLNERFLPNCVVIDQAGYSEMCIDALKILSTTAATDFGSSRQRDLGQLWGDMTRGYLGEYAFQMFLRDKAKMECKLGHEKGKIEDYLPTDIKEIKEPSGGYRAPKIKVGVKAVKWNGIWFDIPGTQFNHSDVHVLVKVGVERDHLFAFFKQISVFKDKIFKVGEEVGVLSKGDADLLYEKLPSFKRVPAYICGFILKDDWKEKPSTYAGRMGRINYEISEWGGPFNPDSDLDKIKTKEKVPGRVSFRGIGKFSPASRFLFNTGSLRWRKEDWAEVFRQL